MSKHVSFRFPSVRIRFFKPIRSGLCPLSVMLESKVNPIPSIAGANDSASKRLKKLEVLINRLLSKFRKIL